MHDDNQKDLLQSDFEIVDLDAVDGRSALPQPILLQGQHFSTRGRMVFSLLMMVGAIAVISLLWPSLFANAQRVLIPVARTPQVSTSIQDVSTPPLLSIYAIDRITILQTASNALPDKESTSIMSAFDTKNGQLLWQSQPILNTGVDDGKIWFQDTDHSLNAITERDGSLVWRKPLAADATIVEATDGFIYVENSHQDLSVYLMVDGTLLWQHKDAGELVQIEHGLVYTHEYANSQLNALSIRDGSTFWQYHLPQQNIRPIKISNDIVYFVDTNSAINAVRVGATHLLWRHTIAQSDSLAQIIDGKIYIVARDPYAKVQALNGQDGSVLWNFPFTSISFVDMKNGIVYLQSLNIVNAVSSETGKLLWSYQSSGVDLDIQIKGNIVYATSAHDGTVNAIAATKGTVLWHYDMISLTGTKATPNSAMQGFVAHIENGIVYIVSTNDGTLNALRASDKKLLWQVPLGAQ